MRNAELGLRNEKPRTRPSEPAGFFALNPQSEFRIPQFYLNHPAALCTALSIHVGSGAMVTPA